MEYYIYKNFELQGILAGFKFINWVRSYNDVGEFEVEFMFNKELYELLQINDIIYKKSTKEACIITEKYIITNELGEITLNIKGKSLSYFLSYRAFRYTGETNLYDFIYKLLNENFINPTVSNRKINNFRIKTLPQELKKFKLSLEYRNEEVLKAISEQLQEVDYGFRINYLINEKIFEFEVYKGKISDAIFSFQFNNISEQEYFENISIEKNIVAFDDGRYSNNDFSGLNRKESTNEIKKLEKNIEFVMLDISKQYKYLIDWNLGDVVIARNEILEIELNKSVLRIEEFVEATGQYITVAFE